MSTTVALLVALAVAFVAWKALARATAPVVYARMRRNRILLRRVGAAEEVEAPVDRPFSNERSLVADFGAAEGCMKQGLARFRTFLGPVVVVHPLEAVSGGLSEVEQRTLQELPVGAGASHVVVWVGPELSDEQVRAKARGRA